MARSINEIEAELMTLSDKERAEIARDLLLSLEQDIEVDVEQKWIAEAEARYDAYKKGDKKARSVEDALTSARKSLK